MEARDQSAEQLAVGEQDQEVEKSQDHDTLANEEQRDGFGRQLSDIDRQYAAQTGIERRVHIIGTGSIGKLVAHSLRGLPEPPPVTLIFHRYKLLEAWEKGKREITIEDDGQSVSHGGLDVELMPERKQQHGVEVGSGGPDVYETAGKISQPHQVAESIKQESQGKEPARVSDSTEHQPEAWHPGRYAIKDDIIDNLVLTTKAAYTIPALLALRHRLNSQSTICFLQNGMGVIEDVNEQVFPDIESRPNYIQGIITHGVNVPPQKAEEDPFFAVHAGHGTISLGLLPRAGMKNSPPEPSKTNQSNDDTQSEVDETKNIQPERWAPSSRYLLRTLTRSPVLCGVGFTAAELLQLQLEKLAVNSVLNVLTALLDNRNGTVLYNFALTRTMRLMLAETSHVIRSLPELQHVPNVQLRFSAERLESLVVSVAHKTRNNISSTLADVRAGRKTELDYINGYIVKRGEEIGIKCVVNYAMMQTVIGKAQMVTREVDGEVPGDVKNLNPD